MTTELDRRVEELASKQHRVFTTAQVLLLKGTHGSIRHRKETGRWVAAGRGLLRLVGASSTWESELMGIVLTAPCDAVVSHRAAAQLYGLPGFSAGMLELTTHHGHFLRREGVVQHRSTKLPEHHQRLVSGLPVTSVARTLFDLSAVVHERRAERATDNALASGLVTWPALAGVFDELSGRGRRRAAVFGRIVADRQGSYVPLASELEARFVELVRDHGLPAPERQVDLGDADGWIGCVDFWFRDARLVVEVDGGRFHSGLLDRAQDRARDARLRAMGCAVLRFGWSEVTLRPAKVAGMLRGLLSVAA